MRRGIVPRDLLRDHVQLRQQLGEIWAYRDLLVRLVRKELPYGASPTDRGSLWVLEDPFLRFWFRFVFPYQAELESGLQAEDLFDAEVTGSLADHVSPVPVTLTDERLTTAVATRRLHEGGVRGKRKRSVVDQAAAVEILQQWLDQRRRK